MFLIPPPLTLLLNSFIKITLPDNAGGLSESAQEQFEQLLIDHGLLKTGVLAVGDEISRSMNEDTHAAARTVKETTAEYAAYATVRYEEILT